MLIEELMTKDVLTCRLHDTMNDAAQIMWDHDCGAVPVVDDTGRVVGMITDRDVCMAAYTQGKPLAEIPIWIGASKEAITVHAYEPVRAAESLMQANRVRRLPVVDGAGKPIGMLSLADIARKAGSTEERPDGVSSEAVAKTLYDVSVPYRAN